MTCKEFKEKIGDITVLAFINGINQTYIYRFRSKLTTFFMRKFIDTAIPDWDTVLFYKISGKENFLDKDGRIDRFEDKADFLYTIAKSQDQSASKCVLKETLITPDMSALEGKKVKIHVLSDRRNK